MDQSEQSILFRPAALAILCNNRAIDEIRIFCKSLQVWTEQPPPIYLYCSSEVQTQVQTDNVGYVGTIYTRVGLDLYAKLSREEMERRPSRKGLSNLFHDFTQEKCTLMEWALESLTDEEKPRGVLFCDADLIWFAPLPLIPVGPTLGLSPHMIRASDEAIYGEYNAGWIWTNDLTMPATWRAACRSSRFFEQAALEDLADARPDESLYTFPIQINYGWWRMFQSDQSIQERQAEWGRSKQMDGQSSGLTVRGQPLVCIHTHIETNDATTHTFNMFVMKQLEVCKNKNPKAFMLYTLIQ